MFARDRERYIYAKLISNNMGKAQRKVIDLLSEHKELSINEIHLLSGYSKSGVRGRISELRREGYTIEVVEKPTKKYVYKGTGDPVVDKIEALLEAKNLFGQVLEYRKLAKALETNLPAVENAVASMYNRYDILQLSQTKVIIKKLENLK